VSHSSVDFHVAVLGVSAVGLYQRCGESCERLGGLPIDGSPAAAAEAFEQLLAEQRAGGRLMVVLSSQFSRLCLVPWSREIVSPLEQMNFARLCLENIYGPSSDDWALRLSPDAAGAARLAAAVPDELLQRLTAAATGPWRLASLQPYQMAVFNRFRVALGNQDFLLVVVEPGRCSLMVARKGAWASTRSLSFAGSKTALQQLIERELQLLEARDGAPVVLYLYAPEHEELGEQQLLGLVPELLSRPGDGEDAMQAMAWVVN